MKDYTNEAEEWLKEIFTDDFFKTNIPWLRNIFSDFANHIINTQVIEKIDGLISEAERNWRGGLLNELSNPALVGKVKVLKQLKKQLSDD